MKVLIDFRPAKGCENYEGARLRKTLKGACESADVTWVESLLSSPDVAHFLSPDDGGKAKKAKDKGCKVVFSIGYSDSDPKTNFFYKKNGGLLLKRKGLKTLSYADLLLVPDVETKERLENGLIKGKIVVLEPTVNLARFECVSAVERSVFKRYFSVKDGEPYALAIGEYQKKGAVACFEDLAKRNPELKFYVLFNRTRSFASTYRANKENARAPKNLFYSPLVEDDVYRSALLGASAFIKFGNSNDAVSLYEAFASKTPVIAIGENEEAPFLKNGKNCLAYQKAADVPNLLQTLSKDEMREIIITAYRQARDNALPIFGKKLKACYQDLIKQKGGHHHD
ncbi:MAG: glycosyltransferase [Bacilli bacterium]|nr:glycosyltransferase [Bacilli bacterium]